MPPLEYLNEMRNALAHNDEYVLNDEKASNLYERLDDKLQLNVQLMEQSMNERGFPARLRFGIAYLYAEVVERFILLKARREGKSVGTVMW